MTSPPTMTLGLHPRARQRQAVAAIDQLSPGLREQPFVIGTVLGELADAHGLALPEGDADLLRVSRAVRRGASGATVLRMLRALTPC